MNIQILKLIKLLNNIDLDDSSLTNCVIMKRLEIVLKKDLNTFKKQIYNTINTFWDELVASNLVMTMTQIILHILI